MSHHIRKLNTTFLFVIICLFLSGEGIYIWFHSIYFPAKDISSGQFACGNYLITIFLQKKTTSVLRKSRHLGMEDISHK